MSEVRYAQLCPLARAPARRFELRVGGERIRFEGGPEGFHTPAEEGAADLVIEARPEHPVGLLTGLLPASVARARGVRLAGDAAALAALPRLFRFESPSRAPIQGQGAKP